MNLHGIKKQRQKQLVKTVYLIRILVYAFISILFSVAYFHQNLSSLIWISLLTFCLVWPHFAYYKAINNQASKKTKFINFVIDSFFSGITLPLMSFSIIPTVAMLVVYNLSSISIGGLRLFFKGLPFFILGILVFTVVPINISLQPETVPVVNFACIPLLLLYPTIVALKTYNTSKANNIDKINIELQNLKLEKAFKQIKRQHKILKNFAQLDGLTGYPQPTSV